jgi:glutathione S-transferase
MVKVWGRIALNVDKVIWCLEELRVPFERTFVGGKFGGLNTPEFAAMNPNRKVPVIADEGFILWESNAIVRYLAAKYGDGTIWPSDLRHRGDVDRWMDWQAAWYTPAMVPAFVQLIRVPQERRDHDLVESSLAATRPFADMLDGHLADREYMTGTTFTTADIVIGCATHRWLNFPVPQRDYPNLRRWYLELKKRPFASVLHNPLA